MRGIPKERLRLADICTLAKEGDSEAISYLWEVYSLRVYTFQEVDKVNSFRKEGLTTEQAINKLKEEANNGRS